MGAKVVAPAALHAHTRRRLTALCAEAVARARRSGRPTLAALALDVDPSLDPSSAVCSSRRSGEPWACLEQPARDGRALAALGCTTALEAAGADRFERVAGAWRALAADAVVEPAAGGGGPVAVGGFAFAPDGGGAPEWVGFPPASLVVPELALARRAGRVTATLTALAQPDDFPEELAARLSQRAGDLRATSLPLVDPAPAERARVVSAMPPEHYVAAVARAVERIERGELAKIVLAREVQVHSPTAHDPAAILGVLRDVFADCYVFCVGRGESALIGASPELLVRREGQRASTVALAGSIGRSADPAVDDHLGERLLRSGKDREEQAIVARRIEQTLRPRSVWVAAPPEPVLVRMANIQHLATPIRAQLAEPIGAVDLAGLMHPTPAVGGEPFERAAPLIPALEGLDRGWYAGPLGWTDAAEDGEFSVTLRCALLRGGVAHCYAGDGVVRDSDPEAELAETEVKLGALLPLLAA